MADISSLSNLQSTEPLDLPVYQSARASRPFPKAGRYTARVRENFPAEAFGESKAGYLTVSVDPTIVGGEYDGYCVNFTKLSAKTWKNREGLSESQLGRYLKACGSNAVVGGTPQEQADAAETTANQLITIDVDWIAQSRANNFELKGMKNFPLGEDGQPTRFLKLDGTSGRPLVKDPITMEPLTVRAYLEVTRFSVAVQ